MARKRKHIAPRYTKLMQPTFDALRQMGGSGTNGEIYDAVIKNLRLADDIINELHPGSTTQTELEYQLAWARTYLKKYGAISSSGRSVWAITPDFLQIDAIDPKDVDRTVRNANRIGESRSKAFEEPEVQEIIEISKQKTASNGSVIVRKSGTEPVIKVRVEGEDAQFIASIARQIVETLEKYKD